MKPLESCLSRPAAAQRVRVMLEQKLLVSWKCTWDQVPLKLKTSEFERKTLLVKSVLGKVRDPSGVLSSTLKGCEGQRPGLTGLPATTALLSLLLSRPGLACLLVWSFPGCGVLLAQVLVPGSVHCCLCLGTCSAVETTVPASFCVFCCRTLTCVDTGGGCEGHGSDRRRR